jgi:hypothetical protein
MSRQLSEFKMRHMLANQWAPHTSAISACKVTMSTMLRIRDVYPGSRTPDLGSQIPDPKTSTKERGEKKFVIIPFFVATNFTKLKIILFLKCRRKKFGPIFKEF